MIYVQFSSTCFFACWSQNLELDTSKRPKKAFKRSLKEMLLDILETEDSYFDVDTIIVKMKK